MRLLITGASGFIGGYVVAEAMRRGHEVVAMVRAAVPQQWTDSAGPAVLKWDLAEDREPPLDGLGIDCVVHLAAALSGSPEAQRRATVHGTERLLQAMRRAGIRRLVGVGSIAVLDYEALPALSCIDEAAALCRDAGRMGGYAALKARQEALFAAFAAASGDGCAILRPGLVYDEQRLIAGHAGVLKGPLRLLAAHRGEVPTVEVRGLARAIVAAAEAGLAGGEVIHLVDDNLPGQPAYLAALRRRRALGPGGLVLPWWLLTGLARLAYGLAGMLGLAHRLPEGLLPQASAARFKPFRYANAKAKRLLGWQPGTRFS